jgi:hypothetical protein
LKKQYTIPCDRCGYRLKYLEAKCPNCGEEIRGRIPDDLKEIISKKFATQDRNPRYGVLIFFLILDLLFFAGIFMADYVEKTGLAKEIKFGDDDYTAMGWALASFGLLFAIAILAVIIFIILHFKIDLEDDTRPLSKALILLNPIILFALMIALINLLN